MNTSDSAAQPQLASSVDVNVVQAQTVESDVTTPQILVIDDDEDNLILTSYALEAFGYSCVTAKDGSTGIAIAIRQRLDLIFLDILLPGMDGIAVFQKLQQSSVTRDVPVVAITALAKAEDRIHFQSIGFADYITKPYMIEELDLVIKRLL
jgi:CheY-like chemotaxis protein